MLLTPGLLGLGRQGFSSWGLGWEGWGLAGAGLRPKVLVISGLAAPPLQMAPPPAWRPAQMLYSCASPYRLALEPRGQGQGWGGLGHSEGPRTESWSVWETGQDSWWLSEEDREP